MRGEERQGQAVAVEESFEGDGVGATVDGVHIVGVQAHQCGKE